MNPLNALDAYFKTYRPRKIPGRKFCIRSGVAILLADRPFAGQPHVMMIRRAKREGDPWSGHMGFPGGRAESDDQSIFHAALRELREETGLADKNGLEPLGRLSELVTRAHEKWVPMIVTPFVFRLDRLPSWRLSGEVDELVWIPLSFLTDRENRTTMTWGRRVVAMRMPCYFYGGRRIWGLSLMMLDELMTILAHMDGGTPIRRRLFNCLRPSGLSVKNHLDSHKTPSPLSGRRISRMQLLVSWVPDLKKSDSSIDGFNSLMKL